MDYRARFYSPALGRFLQPDTIIPNPANPQSLNRFGYVGNNSIVFNDPTGHIKCEFDAQGNDFCYENDRKTKIIKEPSDDPPRLLPKCPPRGACPQDETESPESQIRDEIDLLFDPFIGSYPSDFVYEGSTAEYYNLLANDAYIQSGYDLQEIAFLGINNPMKDSDWLAADVPIEYIYSKGGLASHAPYYFFVREMNLELTYNNFEPNYLNAMMNAHPLELQAAKDMYYQELINAMGSPEAILEWMKITKELVGPDIIDP